MSIHELEAKCRKLQELKDFENEVKAEIAAMENEIKALMQEQPAKDLSSIKIREAMNGAERKEGIENQAHPSGPDKLYGKWAVKRRAKQACRSCCPA